MLMGVCVCVCVCVCVLAGELLGAWPRTMRTGSEKVLAATKSGPVRRKPASASSSNGSKRQEGTQTPVQEKPVIAKKNVETMAA